ncbi:CBS domain-containing protein [Goodfellowiella coeruleoviolacea]|uniref:BON domain-containing protein n=1 Tax=Goodfellowiella coeruleoviolacea TaxID=334858 RepID=A0AAE3GMA2_9PSEU|nr:CBS domain-containing protein [Goodfellowiella coeruleoviolacea]MCP2170175.1 BON domain-containing protein [Goodfellowiella coeruleoviolacea]
MTADSARGPARARIRPLSATPAREIMTTPVICVPPDASPGHAATLLAHNGFAALPVVDTANRVLGVVSETDLIRCHLPVQGADSACPTTVGEVMTSTVISAAPDTDVRELSERLLRHRLRSVPVLAPDRVVLGIVARRDAMRTLVHQHNSLAAQVRHHLENYWGPGRRWDIEVDNRVVTVTGEFHDAAERGVVQALVHVVPGVEAVHTRLRSTGTVCRR